jgi:hypothetical protein
MTPSGTTYEVWQHTVTQERFFIRIEYDALTGVYGPLPPGKPPADPETLDFEDHPDDLEWIVRSVERFRILPR